MPPLTPRSRESTGKTATRSGATVGLATVLGALVAPRLAGIDATAASVLVGSVLGALAGLGAAIGTVARDRVGQGHDGFVTQLLATLLVLPLALALPGCRATYQRHLVPPEVEGHTSATPIEVTSWSVSLLRQDQYAYGSDVDPDARVVRTWAAGCDQNISGNLSAVGIAGTTIVGGPAAGAVAGAGIAGAEWLKRRGGEKSTEQTARCFPFLQRPPWLEEEDWVPPIPDPLP